MSDTGRIGDPASARMRRVSAAMGIGYCEGDPRTGVFRLDEAAALLLDLPAEVPLPASEWAGELLGRVHPGDLRALRTIAEELIASGSTASADFRYRIGDGGSEGQTRNLSATACIDRDAAGHAVQLTIGLRDITAVSRTRAELRDVKQRFSVLIENVDDVFWIVDWRTRRQLYVSPSYSRCWGCDEARLLAGEPRWPDKIHRDDRAAVAAAFEALADAAEGDDHFAIEYRISNGNGEQRWIRDRGIAVRADDGSIDRVVGIAEDITDRRTVVRTLREREQNLQQAMEAAQLHVWTLHTPTRRLSVSDALCATFGLTSETCRRLGPWRRRLHPKDRPRVETALRRLMTDGEAFREEFRVRRSDGSTTWLDARAILIADEDGHGAQIHGVAADISERKQREQAQHASGRRLQLALDGAHLFAWSYEPATGKVNGDAGVYRLFFGEETKPVYTADDWRAAIHPDDLQRVAAALRETLAGGAEFDAEYRIVHPDRTVRWVRAQLVLVQDDDGSSIGYGVLGDITERRRIEQQLRDSERELRTIAAAVPIGISRISRDLRYLFMNEAYAAWMRRSTPEQLIGRSVLEVAGEAAVAAVRPFVDQVLAGQPVDYEVRLSLPPGERYIHASYTPEWNEAGAVTSFVAVTTDITERKRAEEKLYEREREFKTLADNAPDLIARVDRHLAYLYINRAAEAAFGIDRAAYAGRTAAELGFPPQYVRATEDIIAAAFARGEEQSTNLVIPGRDERSHFSARAVPEFDREGEPESVLLIVYDISERMRGQVERDTLLVREHEARRQAEASARGRDEFLAIVSHELRSPLNGIQNWAHVLESIQGNGGNKLLPRAIAGIKTGVEQQVRLIDDLLDATRIITGKLSLLLTPVKLAPVIAASIESVRDKLIDKHIVLSTEIELGDATIEGDADRLQQIVWNLLSNAIKFTTSGGHVWLTARREDDCAVIRVRDDGRGIDADFLPQLFERFRRDETGNSRGQGGLGLGLMLVRNLCELHRGNVVAASPGRGLGAVFTVRLPLRRTGASSAPAIAPDPLESSPSLQSLGGLRLLLVDDHVESRDPLAVLLLQTGAVVDVLSSGEEAVQVIKRGPFGAERPDLLICDIAMPGQDGYETLRLIREFERSNGLPMMPAIALTAFAQNEDRARALEAGFQTHIAKPVIVKELIATIAVFAPIRGKA